MPDLRTCLWFGAGGEDAVAFYVSLLPDSRIEGMDRPAPDAPPILIRFTLMGAPYAALCAAGAPAATHAASIVVEMDQAQADRVYDAILARGGKEVQCGWVTDAWGVSWQIVPKGMFGALFGGDAAANQRAFAAMQQMKRLDVAAVLAAREAA